MEDSLVTVSHHHYVGPATPKNLTGMIAQNVDDRRIRGLIVQKTTDSLGKAEPEVRRQEGPVQQHRSRMTQERPQPPVQAVGGGLFVPMCEMKVHPFVSRRQRPGHEAHAELLLEIVPMPGIMIAKQIRNRRPSIRPPSKKGLEPNESFGDQMTIFDEAVEHVADEVKMLHSIGVRLQTVNQGCLFRTLSRGRPTPEMHVRNEKNHRIK
jgi:hypothetical protein